MRSAVPRFLQKCRVLRNDEPRRFFCSALAFQSLERTRIHHDSLSAKVLRVSGSSGGGNSDGMYASSVVRCGSGTYLKVATFVRPRETPRCRSSNAQTVFAETKCRVFTCSPHKPKRRGHWACTGCGSMAVGGHGDVQGCVHLGRRKASRFWAMLNHYFGRCHLAEIESLICNRCPSRLRHIRYTWNKP